MLRKLEKLWKILERQQKQSIILIQFSVILLAFFELFTIASVAAFMQIVTDEGKLKQLIEKINIFNDMSNDHVLLISSLTLIFILSLSSFLSVIIFKKSTHLSMHIGHQIACRLLDFYLSCDWLYHSNNNSSTMINNILSESNRLSSGVINPFISIISKIILICIISFAIFIYNPLATLCILIFFVSSYAIISKIVKGRLLYNSMILSKSNREQIKSVNEAIDSIKMVILNNKKEYFLQNFFSHNLSGAQGSASNMTLSLAPRFMMEWLAFVSMILIVIFTLLSDKNIDTIIPLLTIYGLAAFKLLPSIQLIYGSFANIKGNISALEIITHELEQFSKDKLNEESMETIIFDNTIEISNGVFTYPNKNVYAINELTITIKKNQMIGVVGESGSGKSTLIDILCGLIKLNSGVFKIDGIDINDYTKAWQKHISYVPQTISLSDASIAENIAFGVKIDDIDWGLLTNVINLSCLDDLIDALDIGFNTIIGEKGVQLSGGQRQRIGIARALYKNSNVLILDEATSALDGITENKIMQAIKDLTGKMTIIIIAHRLKTIKNCDCIYMLKNGQVVDSNNYEELLKNNREFQEMARYA